MSTRKGQKGQRNIPYFYDEVKKAHGISVTDKAWKLAQNEAKRQGLSVSELFERWIRDTAG